MLLVLILERERVNWLIFKLLGTREHYMCSRVGFLQYFNFEVNYENFQIKIYNTGTQFYILIYNIILEVIKY